MGRTTTPPPSLRGTFFPPSGDTVGVSSEAAVSPGEAHGQGLGLILGSQGRHFILVNTRVLSSGLKKLLRGKEGESTLLPALGDLFMSSIVGSLEIIPDPHLGPEDVWVVASSAASKGYGPLLYDLAMSAVYPGYLRPSAMITPSAKRVWSFYFGGRSGSVEHVLPPGLTKATLGKVPPDKRHLEYIYRIKRPISLKQLLKNGERVEELHRRVSHEIEGGGGGGSHRKDSWMSVAARDFFEGLYDPFSD